MTVHQSALPFSQVEQTKHGETYRARLVKLLSHDLDFHGEDSSYASHVFHSFPAKFPPQLPRRFITELTRPGDSVLDPMMGSGTTVVEAFLSRRRGIGFDIDPLALLISRVKVSLLDPKQVAQIGNTIFPVKNRQRIEEKTVRLMTYSVTEDNQNIHLQEETTLT